ncbi:hypothetical protein YB2330_003664 [Saitoella coloradoensis]
MPDFTNKVAIITGANSPLGIGLATAHELAAGSAKAIYICDLSTDHLENNAAELRKAHPKTDIIVKSFDAGDEEALKVVIGEAMSTYSRLDIFFANAGIIGSRTPLSATTTQTFSQVLHTNTTSVFLALKHASAAMLRSPSPSTASFIATASVAGLRNGAGPMAYSASKAAVINIVQNGAWELGGTGIRVNAICPGLIETGMTNELFTQAREKGRLSLVGQLNPLRRYGVAKEIAKVVAFLASEEGGYVNGQAWAVDGGLSASLPVIPPKPKVRKEGAKL